MTKAPINLQELRRRIYRKAKSDKTHRFWGLFVHVTKVETLEEAYRIAESNGGAAGVDGLKFQDIELAGRSAFLAAVREDLITGRYKPMPNRRMEIPKGNAKVRTLQIPCIRDRVVQGAAKLILEADSAFSAVSQDREADPGPASPAPGEADHQSRRKGRCPARGTVQPAGGEHLSERGGLVL
jgi:retron-type reverse transcriptase